MRGPKNLPRNYKVSGVVIQALEWEWTVTGAPSNYEDHWDDRLDTEEICPLDNRQSTTIECF